MLFVIANYSQISANSKDLGKGGYSYIINVCQLASIYACAPINILRAVLKKQRRKKHFQAVDASFLQIKSQQIFIML